MKVGSLFSGVGGFDLGLERAGHEIVWQVEIDPFCCDVLAKHWPNVLRYEDVRLIGKELAPVDIICGGFPCQPVSRAGRRKAQADPRWLWPEFARLVCELEPRYVLLENTDGLLKRGFGDILRDLAAFGYDVEWESICASHFGAPHRRERVFAVAYTDCDGWKAPFLSPGAPLSDSERHLAVSQARWKDIKYRAGKPVGGGIEPGISGVDDGLPYRVDRVTSLGNALVPQIAEWIGRKLA